MALREDPEQARQVQRVAARAARRLDFLEWVMYAVAAVLAVAGGALAALLLAPALGLPFRAVWTVAALLMFVVPGLLALRKMRSEERQRRETLLNDDETHV